ncbi:MAG: efflux RND transporter periplasmic adaptor subunit [Candidatus Omnitrophica bacterium]|nr:efflux RND transporter periplasmic adaptor subunit [Candidatus Omnitrophota bacterium]
MAKRKFLAAVLLGMAVVAGGLAIRAMHPGRPPHSHPSGKAVYYCPMHPAYTSDRPGDCPICGMKLVKREARPPAGESPHRHGLAPVQIPAEKQQLIGVKTAPAGRREMVHTIRTSGRIAYDPELYQAQQEYLQAVKGLETARGGSNAEIEEQARRLVEATEVRLRLMGLGDGFIREMAGWKEPDQSLLLRDGQGRVWLYATVYEYELPYVQVGQTIRAQLQAFPGKVLEGKIRAVDSLLDAMTRTARARAVLTDSEGILKPEMYLNASVEVPLGNVLAVPEEAVLDTGVRRILFVDKGEGLLEPREVTAGARSGGYVEIRNGVSEGERVVTSGNFLIDSESRLQAALEGMESGEHHHGD